MMRFNSTENAQRQVTVVAVLALVMTPFLTPMNAVVIRPGVEHDLLVPGFCRCGFQRRPLQAIQRTLAGQRLAPIPFFVPVLAPTVATASDVLIALAIRCLIVSILPFRTQALSSVGP